MKDKPDGKNKGKPKPKAAPKPKAFALKPSSPLESAEQAALFEHAKSREAKDPRWRLLFAIPNGTAASSIHQAVLAKKTGAKKGVPDMFLPVPMPPWHGLFVELKRVGGVASDISKEQAAWLADLQEQGYQTVVAFGWKCAAGEIEYYLNPT